MSSTQRKGNNYWPGSGVKNLSVGNTEVIAHMIAEFGNFDLIKVEEAQPYPADYRETTEVAQQEFASGSCREYKSIPLVDFSQYDNILIGHPVWWSRMPSPLAKWISDNNDGLNGKTIVQFGTHEGSGISSVTVQLRNLIKAKQFLEPLSLYGHECSGAGKAVEQWLKKNHLI